jgi:signal transduction histidine kinase
LHISATFIDAEYRVRGLESADGYLTEPISREELLATVGALLRLKQAERDARTHAAEAESARNELMQAHDELELRVAERTRELAERSEEIRELTGKLLRLQDDERRRIARELHDSTGQMLAAMKMNLDRLNVEAQGQNASLVGETISISDELSRQMRTMSYLLHPPLLDEVGLPSALAWYSDGFAERSGIKVELQISPEFGRLPNDLEIAIFRVIQECLTNIHRHANSPTASIRLVRAPEGIQVEIADSGTGIASHRTRAGRIVEGIGLMGIKERMRQFGGSVTVTSSEQGTRIIATLPASSVVPS